MMQNNRLVHRTILAALLALVFLGLTACTNNDAVIPTATNEPDASVVSELPVSSPDTGTSLPTKTNKLILYNAPQQDIMDVAIRIFKSKFPEVEVEVRDFNSGADNQQNVDNFISVLTSDLTAGKGPDVIMWWFEIPDIYKTMEAGAFENLAPYFAQDETFHTDEFTTAIFDAGIYKTQRFFVPLDYSVSTWLTTQEALQNAGLTLSETPTFAEFTEQITQYCQKYAADNNKWIIDTFRYSTALFLPWCGVTYLDYETGTVSVDTPEFKQAMDTYKVMYDMLFKREERGVALPQPYWNGDTEKLIMNNRLLFSREWNALWLLSDRYAGLLTTQTPMLIQMPNITGGKTVADINHSVGIRKNSENKQNAYEFIKILLSDEVQSSTTIYSLNIPVRTESLTKKANTIVARTGGGNGDGSIRYTKPSGEMATSYVQSLTDVTYTQHRTRANEYVWEAMLPYFEGQKSYEACIAELQNKLELYIAE